MQQIYSTNNKLQTEALVHLQSITIVFLKIVLTNVSAVVSQNGQNGQTMRYAGPSFSSWLFLFWHSSLSDGYSSVQGFSAQQNSFPAEVAIDELDNIRLREITGKAISGALLLLLKWFKRSRKTIESDDPSCASNWFVLDVLKFEYMTQLLLDSNYLPLILKMFAHQDIDQAVAQKNDRDEFGWVLLTSSYSICCWYPQASSNSVASIRIIRLDPQRTRTMSRQPVKTMLFLHLYLGTDRSPPKTQQQRIRNLQIAISGLKWTN